MTITQSISQSAEIASLLDLSARAGSNPLLVQAGTGNTSIKVGPTLWIKASGKWLAHAKYEDILVPLPLEEVRSCLRLKRELCGEYASATGAPLKPSIETAMHAVLPHRVVIHVHSISTIAWAVQRDGPSQIAARLAGLPWRWVPYLPSGRPLALAIERALHAAPGARAFVLANHGLVVCGDSCEETEELLSDIERRLDIIPRPVPPPNRTQLDRHAGSAWRYPESQAIHALATDPVSRRILDGGFLYPCHAIFFGPDVRPAFLLVEDAGVLVHETITKAERAMLAALAGVIQRIDSCAHIAYLPDHEVVRALNSGASQYRVMMQSNGSNHG